MIDNKCTLLQNINGLWSVVEYQTVDVASRLNVHRIYNSSAEIRTKLLLTYDYFTNLTIDYKILVKFNWILPISIKNMDQYEMDMVNSICNSKSPWYLIKINK